MKKITPFCMHARTKESSLHRCKPVPQKAGAEVELGRLLSSREVNELVCVSRTVFFTMWDGPIQCDQIGPNFAVLAVFLGVGRIFF
jgi:hypothetical protein